MPADAELLRRYAEHRSESAFSELVLQHLGLVYSAALRRTGGDPHRAADITQQVFISLAAHATALSRHSSLVGWLYTCTRNAALADARAEKRRRIREQEAYAMQNLELSQPGEADWARLRVVLDAVMDELGGKDREAILLRFFSGCSYREVGEKLALREDAARRRVDRSLDRLRGSLARRGVTSTGAALAAVLVDQAVVAAPAGLAETVTGAALARATAGGITASHILGLLKIMSTTKASVGILSGVCILAVGSSIFEARQARQAELSLTAANEADLGRIRDLQAKLAEARNARSASQQAIPANPSRVSANRPAAPSYNLDDMRKDPAFEGLWRKQQLRAMQLRYGAAFANMKLLPDELEKLKNLLVARVQARLDAAEVGQEAGLTGPELSAAERQAEGAITDEIKGLVGNDGYAQLQASQMANQYEQEVSSSIGVDLSAAGIPLMPDQVSSLAQTISDQETRFGQGAGKQNPDPQTGLTPFFQSLLDRVAPIVTPAQLQLVKNNFVELEQENQFYRKQAAAAAGRH